MQIMHFTFPNPLWMKNAHKSKISFEEYQILKKLSKSNKNSDQIY